MGTVKDLSTTYRRRQIAFNNIPEPKEIVLGQRVERKFDKKLNTYIETPTVDTFMYISLIDNLKYLCSNRAYQKLLLNTNSNDCDILSDISDGSFIKNSDLHSSGEVTLKIQLYIDDFEPVNGMGYKTNIHKTTAMYYIIRNIGPMHNSKLKNIHLLGFAFSADVRKYGYDKILHSFVTEVKLLERDGFQVDFLNGQSVLKGGLVAISADNLGANSLLGFVESFAAHQYCRHCLIERSNVNNVLRESEVILRNVSNYNEHINLLETQNNVHGIKRPTILNDLSYFHILNAPTVDIMHDILEGVAQWRIAEFFDYITKEKILTQQQINNKVAAFNFGYMEKTSLPNSITFDKVTVGLKAAQTWCFIRHIPLIFVDIFESDEQKIKDRCNLIRLLLNCMLIIFAPKISNHMIDNLEIKIYQFLSGVIQMFPSKTLKPKEHFLVHYPRIIREMGPIIFLWCMRFEGKHLYFKKLAQSNQNFVNICKTFSLRHQEYINHINSSPTESLSFKLFSTNDEIDFTVYSDLLLRSKITEDVTFVKTLSSNNDKYKTNLFILTSVENDLPVFNEILAIFSHKNEAYFILDQWQTMQLNSKLIVYEIEKKESLLSVLALNDLLYLTPFDRLIVLSKHYIVPKHVFI